MRRRTSAELEKGANASIKDKDCWTPLYRATKNGHQTIVKLLLKKGADANAKTFYGSTPLQRAAEKGHGAVVELLRSN